MTNDLLPVFVLNQFEDSQIKTDWIGESRRSNTIFTTDSRHQNRIEIRKRANHRGCITIKCVFFILAYSGECRCIEEFERHRHVYVFDTFRLYWKYVRLLLYSLCYARLYERERFQPLDDNYMMIALPIKLKEMFAFGMRSYLALRPCNANSSIFFVYLGYNMKMILHTAQIDIYTNILTSPHSVISFIIYSPI